MKQSLIKLIEVGFNSFYCDAKVIQAKTFTVSISSKRVGARKLKCGYRMLLQLDTDQLCNKAPTYYIVL